MRKSRKPRTGDHGAGAFHDTPPATPRSVIELLPVGDLKPDPRNARKHSEHQYQLLASSILKFGFRGAIGIDENNQIVFGHGRWEGAKRAKMMHVPCERIRT